MQQCEMIVQADQEAVFGCLADVTRELSSHGQRYTAHVLRNVEASRFGTEQALSVRLESDARGGEIGKVIVRPLGDRHLLVVPQNGTGGATPPDLDPRGELFCRILQALLQRMMQLGLLPPPEKEKRRIGFVPNI